MLAITETCVDVGIGISQTVSFHFFSLRGHANETKV